jgi:hypothetical protein
VSHSICAAGSCMKPAHPLGFPYFAFPVSQVR